MIAPDRLYEALADHYVELCAVSQYRPLDGAPPLPGQGLTATRTQRMGFSVSKR